MAAPFIVLLLIIITLTNIQISSAFHGHTLTPGASLSVENKDDDLLVSPNGLFTAGFHPVGENAFAFAVWFSEKTTSGSRTVVWMANRDTPVNGKLSKLSLWKDGNLVLIDAGQYVVWSTQTESTSSSTQLQLHNSGNLVLHGGRQGQEQPLWESFDHPTDTLLPNQLFTKNTQLVSSRSSTNYSSGFYKLFFDNDSILRLLYNGPETTSIYWPDPRITTWRAGRFQFIDSRKASFDSNGEFVSSDGFGFKSADFGTGPQRMMKIDIDGNLRIYSLVVDLKKRKKWEVQWQAVSQSCRINGACGPNSLCTYNQDSVRICSCLHGYKMVNPQDWSYGCKPEFQPCVKHDCGFLQLPYAEFYGYDYAFFTNYTLDACKNHCLQNTTCTGFNLGWISDKGYFCFLKTSLHNGYQRGVYGVMFIKLPKTLVSSYNQKNNIPQSSFTCPHSVLTPITRSYDKTHDEIKILGVMLVLGCIIGVIEIICIVFFWYCSSKPSLTTDQIYFPPATEFRRFTYSELKRASRNFSEEIGRGGSSIVYKGRLTDNRIAAIKKLKSNQEEAEFQAEISTIGRVNHMNLLETWGYCAEGKHRLVVYEYMENGSLAEKLGVIGNLEWATRLEIAKGTAKGLAYLHDECLEWVLHCDVKPQNILLDADCNPKVADFGLSKVLDRGSNGHWNFSMMRGTRGYMAPEWVLNQPITSKVDVFSYGVVMLEMITGKSPATNQDGETMIDWVRDTIREVNGRKTESWVKGIVDPSVKGEYDESVMENLVRIAVQCTEEDREARPSMRQVVDMLLHV